ncbi:MAG: hypothetical protein E7667_04660 [Ruminococcaceae bacterium]|nr:hypothetical protein [Oscillospiraceae bacterium]
MNVKTKRNMGLSSMILSFFFLFNPDFSAVDPIPDIIGYAILYFALVNLADVNYHFEEARIKFKYAIYAGFAEIAAILILFGIVAPSERSMFTLIIAFVFSVIDLIILLPAYKEFFEGFINLGTLNDGEAMFVQRNGRGEYTDRTYHFTVAFVITKSVCACLPEFSALIENEQYRFITILRFFGFIITMVVGIIWLVKIIGYVRAIKKDRVFIDSISEKYKSMVITRPGLFTKRQLLFGIGCIFAGFALSLDIYGDYYNFIPDFLSAAAICFGCFKLKKFSRRWISVFAVSALYGGVSLVSWVQSLKFFKEYYPQSVLKKIEAAKMYNFIYSTYICNAVIFTALVVLCVLMLSDIAKTHAAPRTKDKLSKDDLYYEELSNSSLILCIFAALSSIMTLYYKYSITRYSYDWYIHFAIIFTVVCDLIFVAYAYHFCDLMKKEIANRYALC